MNKLKTLKDMPSLDMSEEFENDHDRYIPESLLRAEAIKWYHRSDGNKHKFIREFFNLTEKDLTQSPQTKPSEDLRTGVSNYCAPSNDGQMDKTADTQARKKQILEKLREITRYGFCPFSCLTCEKNKDNAQELIKQFDSLPDCCGNWFNDGYQKCIGELITSDWTGKRVRKNYFCPSCQAQQEEIKHFKEMFE